MWLLKSSMLLKTLRKWSWGLIQRLKTIFFTILKAICQPRQIAATIVAFLLIGLLHFITFNISVFNPVAQGLKGFSTTDLFYRMMLEAPRDTNDVIVIVDITDLYDRDSIASVLEKIDTLGPAAIDVDVIFERPMDSIGDAHLRKVAKKLSNAVFSFKMMDLDRERNEFTRQAHSFFAKDLNLNEGSVNIHRGVVREIPLNFEMGGKTYPSVIARMKEILQNEVVNQSNRSINYEPTVFRTIRFDSVQHYADLIRNKVVMFGGAHESADMLFTPLGQLHGIEVLCYAMKTMLEIDRMKDCTGVPFWLLTILLSYLGVCCIMAYKNKALTMREGIISDLLRTTLVTSIFVFLLMNTYFVIAFWFFYEYQFNFDLTPTLSVLALATTSADLVRLFIKHKPNTCAHKIKNK